MQPLSQSCPIEINDALVKDGKTCAFCEEQRGIIPDSDACTVVPFGKLTCGPLRIVWMEVKAILSRCVK